MASLKEVKGRIATVNNTRKITSAMKMVASAKLHKAQGAITNMLPYERRLHGLLTNLLGGGEVLVWNTPREVKRVALVVFSSNSSLCGGFNANVIKHATQWLDEHQALGKDNILLYPVGKKVADALSKMGYTIQGNFQHLADKPSFAEAAELAQGLMNLFTQGEVDRVELLYNHFKSTASQILTVRSICLLYYVIQRSIATKDLVSIKKRQTTSSNHRVRSYWKHSCPRCFA